MVISVPAETAPGERRVGLVPETVGKLVKAGHSVLVERGAGSAAAYGDAAYEASGATLASATDVWSKGEVITKVARPNADELARMRAGQTLIAFLAPLGDPKSVEAYAAQKITALSMDAIPRTTKAQSMDALSSQANVGGYKAVLVAASTLAKYFPMLTTAAGTIKPAQVLVIGAGVAGLQAIATAKRLGAVVIGYDARTAVKEQVQSLGAKFLEIDVGEAAEGAGGYAKELSVEALEKQRAAMVKAIGAADVVITTAAVPGRKAPVLVTREAVEAMNPGSVIVDLAAETGGNCELTTPGEVVTSANGVTIVGTTNWPSTVARDASQLYSKNVQTLLDYISKDGVLRLDMDDEIVRGTTLVRDGTIVHAPTLEAAHTASGATS